MIDYKRIKEAVVLIGYYVPNGTPVFHGTGFLVGKGDRALTCAHVVMQSSEKPVSSLRSFPIKKEIDGETAELCCWAFRIRKDAWHILRYPIKEITAMLDVHIESFYIGDFPDVAFLHLDNSQWHANFPSDEPPVLEVSRTLLRTLGSHVAIVGYPSPDLLMLDRKTQRPRCGQPIVQFAHLAGILPFLEAEMPEFLAFDTVFAKGSSGSPIIDSATGDVVAIAAELLPFHFYEDVYAPSSIGFGVPSNYFYEMSSSRVGIGKFNFNYA